DYAEKRSPESELAYTRDLLARVRALPGVNAAGVSEEVLIGEVRPQDLTVEASAGSANDVVRVPVRVHPVARGHVGAAGVALRGGRFCGDSAAAVAPPVVIINETLARHLWSGADAVGRRMHAGDRNSPSPWLTVVGVVADLRRQSPERAP